MRYQLSDKFVLAAEYNPDLMSIESSYLDAKSPWNIGASYKFNDYFNLSTQYLHGSQLSVTAQVIVNPGRPPLLGGKELAPVPMRLRMPSTLPMHNNNESIIRRVLKADRFKIYDIMFKDDTVSITVDNTKFRSTAQAASRIASTLQRFTSDEIKTANISFISGDLKAATYSVNLERIAKEQFNVATPMDGKPSITAIDVEKLQSSENNQRFMWGVGPYITHRLFNPDLPLSLETWVEIKQAIK